MDSEDHRPRIIFMVDASGSMEGKTRATAQMYSTCVDIIRETANTPKVSFVTFDHSAHIRTWDQYADQVKPITNYEAPGGTDLARSLCQVIDEAHRSAWSKVAPVLCIMLTDGETDRPSDAQAQAIADTVNVYRWTYVGLAAGVEPAVFAKFRVPVGNTLGFTGQPEEFEQITQKLARGICNWLSNIGTNSERKGGFFQ